MGDIIDPPWKRQLRPRHVKQEENLGRLPGGRQGVASGRFWRFKRDGGLYDFLIEARTTQSESYRIEKREWLAIRKDAVKSPPGLLPGMQVDIQDISLMVIELDTFLEFQNELIGLRAYVETLRPDS